KKTRPRASRARGVGREGASRSLRVKPRGRERANGEGGGRSFVPRILREIAPEDNRKVGPKSDPGTRDRGSEGSARAIVVVPPRDHRLPPAPSNPPIPHPTTRLTTGDSAVSLFPFISLRAESAGRASRDASAAAAGERDRRAPGACTCDV